MYAKIPVLKFTSLVQAIKEVKVSPAKGSKDGVYNLTFKKSRKTLLGVAKKDWGSNYNLVEIGRAIEKYPISQKKGSIYFNGVTLPLKYLCLIHYYSKFFNYGGNIDGKIATIDNLRFGVLDAINGVRQIVAVFVRKDYDQFNFKGKVVMDIGGYIGETALFFLDRGASKVISYEPHPELFKLLKKNVALNGYKAITHNKAVSAKAGTLDLFVTEELHSSTTCPNRGNNLGSFEVETISIISEIEKHEPDIIKMDCEGEEYAILEELVRRPQTAGKIKEGIILEVHPYDKAHNMARIRVLLRELGFKNIKRSPIAPSGIITSLVTAKRTA